MDDDAEIPLLLDAADAGSGCATQSDLCAALKDGVEHILEITEALHPDTVADLKGDSEYQGMLRRLWQNKALAPPPPLPTPSLLTVATDNSVGPWSYSPATFSSQNKEKGILSSVPKISNSALCMQTIDDTADVGFQELTIKDSVRPHSAEQSSVWGLILWILSMTFYDFAMIDY